MGAKYRCYIEGENLIRKVLLILFILSVLSPVLILILKTITAVFNGNIPEWLELIIPLGRRGGLFVKSIFISAASALSVVIIGVVGVTYFIDADNKDNKRLGIIICLIISTALIPPYVHALSWSAFVFTVNKLLSAVALPALPVQGPFITWWVMTMSYIPLGLGFSLVGFGSIEPLLLEAAFLANNEIKILKRIILPLAFPFIMVGGIFVFFFSLMDYSLPSLFQVSTYSLEIFTDFSATNDVHRAFLLSLPPLCFGILMILLLNSPIRSVALASGMMRIKLYHKLNWPLWFKTMQIIVIAVLVTQVLVPLMSLMTVTGSLYNLLHSIMLAKIELIYTFNVSLAAALICLPLAYTVSKKIVENKKTNYLWWLVFLPLIIPAPLIGIGEIALWSDKAFNFINNSAIIIILANLCRFAPLAVLVLVGQLRRHDKLLVDAARIFEKNSRQTFLKVKIPMLLPGLLSALALVFALCTGELGAILLVIPPGRGTLAMRIYNFMHYGASETVAALCLVMLFEAIIIGTFIFGMLRRAG